MTIQWRTQDFQLREGGGGVAKRGRKGREFLKCVYQNGRKKDRKGERNTVRKKDRKER